MTNVNITCSYYVFQQKTIEFSLISFNLSFRTIINTINSPKIRFQWFLECSNCSTGVHGFIFTEPKTAGSNRNNVVRPKNICFTLPTQLTAISIPDNGGTQYIVIFIKFWLSRRTRSNAFNFVIDMLLIYRRNASQYWYKSYYFLLVEQLCKAAILHRHVTGQSNI